MSGKVQRWSHPGPLGGCSVWGRQGWRLVCLIRVCDHIQVWGLQLCLAKGGRPPRLGLGMPRAHEFWEDTHTTVYHGGWA